jgi:hypothetical protein
MDEKFLVSVDDATARNIMGSLILESVSIKGSESDFKKALALARERHPGFFDIRIVMEGVEFPVSGFAAALDYQWGKMVQNAAAEIVKKPSLDFARRIADKLLDLEQELDSLLSAELEDYNPDFY